MVNANNAPIYILWDMENCPVPTDIRPEDVALNITTVLRSHPIISATITIFSAYGDFNAFPKRLRQGCQRTGVKLIDVPNARKDAADKAILVDMFLFALDNPPPSFIMLISGDVDFSPALHILGQRGYTVILTIPSGVGVSSALRNAGSFVWDWPSVVRGEGFHQAAVPRFQITDNTSGLQNEEETIVYKGFSQTYYKSNDFAVVSKYHNATSRSYSLPSGLKDMTTRHVTSYEQNDLWVQPGDLFGLTGQLVKLLETFNGSLPLARLPAEYQKSFGVPLYVSEYGSMKLVNLLKKMDDKIAIEGKGKRKFVYIKKLLVDPYSPPLDMGKHDRKGKGTREDTKGFVSSDDFSEDERVVLEDHDKTLDKFKFELQEILVSYSCRIYLGCFEAIYTQRYKKPLHYKRFGVGELEELFEKVDDVVVLVEEPVSKKKFLVATSC